MTGHSERPNAGQSVEIHDAEQKSSLGRVQSATDDAVVIAVGTTAAVALTTEDGATFEVVWSGPGGVSILPVRLTRRSGASQLELWEFAPMAGARCEQRRQQARIPVSGPVTLAWLPDAGVSPLPAPAGPPLAGTLIDVSESAMQCVIAVNAGDPVLSTGSSVACEFSPNGNHFSLHGVVHAAWTVDAPPRVRLVVRFDPDQSATAALAAFVTAAERDTDLP